MGFTVGPAPSLDAVFFSDRDVGSILVMTKENDVIVVVDGRTSTRKTTNGQLRLTNMSTQPHRIRVTKDGFLSPEEQSVEVRKGQEAVLRFDLVAVQKPATLQVRQLVPGTQLFLDDGRSLGTVAAGGTLSAELPAGSHALRFLMDGFQPKTITRDVAGGERVVLTEAAVHLEGATAPLETEADPTVTVIVRRDNNQVQQFTGSRKLPLGEGAYIVDGRTSDGRTTSRSVQLHAGGTETVRLTFVADRRMEGFGAKVWTLADTWYRRTSNNPRFALYDAMPPGTFQFTFNPPGKALGVFGGAHVKLVVAFRNERNYILFDLDRSELARTVFVDGKRIELPKVPHKIPWDSDFVHLSLTVVPDRLTLAYRLKEGDWQTLNVWERNDPALAKRAPIPSFTGGRFGFDGEIEMSNFMMRPQ